MIVFGAILAITIHYLLGIVIFVVANISPSDISSIKVWKVVALGGIVMLLHWLVGVIIKKLQVANFNWNLKEWIER